MRFKYLGFNLQQQTTRLELNMVCWTEFDKYEVISRLKEIKQVINKQSK